MREYTTTIRYTPKMIVDEFIKLTSYWYETKTNSFYGKENYCRKYLKYWIDNNCFGPDYDDYNLIYLKSKFKEWLENFKETT